MPIIWGASAGGSYIRVVPVTTSDPNAASYTLGFPPNVFTDPGAGGEPMDGRDLNGALNEITAWVNWLNAGAPVFYDGTFSSSVGGYPKWAVLSNASTPGQYWISIVENNTSDPDAGGANWVNFPSSAIQAQAGNFTATDSGTANAMSITLSPVPGASMAALKGIPIRFQKSGSDSTGACTLSVNGVSAALEFPGGGALFAGALPASSLVEAMSNGSFFELQSQPNPSTLLAGLGFTGSLANPGYVKIPMGGSIGTMVAQWGTVSASVTSGGDVVASVSFPIPFPTAIFTAYCTLQAAPDSGSTNTDLTTQIQPGSKTTSGMNVVFNTFTGSVTPNTYSADWLVIGH